ncbi:hypothetical protein C8A00DRAFT_18303 [Chaetomidium leptoderma]|uniref:Uncharacterized protein n=1 Tax=Chaetomidium leptoderma TaxID=669021 RepID=A0AAN6VER3_9PEZI|nr:hypothetical protein C8A00DRAFT_18303 [Chaetomidium leptoderma]
MDEERTITLDLGSSPDPLIDPILSPPMMPPSHVKKKTQAAERLFTVLAPSPRKQTFELDVGNERSPQRLLVTVEADDDDVTRSTSRRRLFQSPTPKRRLTPRRDATVTTTVPLRGLSDDEGAAMTNATPRKRGRPRKSATPATAARKRPGTPARGRKAGARASVSPQKDILTSDIGIETTPRPTSQPRKAAKRKASSPVKEDGAPGSQPRKRGRPRKQTIAADDIAPASDAVYPARNQQEVAVEDDIWLATLSDQPNPVVRTQQHSHEPEQEELHLPRAEPEYQHQYDWPDMGGGADSHSEAGSLASEERDDQDFEDTVMAEEFTMISIGSLPSMQPNSSVMAPAHEELGEATSLIINGALESLRQSQNRPAEEQVNVEPAPTTVEVQPSATTAHENLFQQNQEQQLPPPASPQSWRQSPRRSPRRAKAQQPLARQLAQKTLQQGDVQSPAPRQSVTDAEPQDASAYEDSFSEIPEAILVAATPRRYRQPQPEAEEPADEGIQPSIERPSRVNHSNPQSETNRLLTPDETPSPVQSDTEDHNPLSKPSRPTADVDLPSSPPIENPIHLNSATSQHIRRNSNETPADQLSSFTSSNMGARDAPSIHLPVPEPHRRPTLSPVVRVGRALQFITSDPPSPPERDSVLGSPFRGSVPKSSQSPAPVLAPVLAPGPPATRTTRSPSQPRLDAFTQSPQRSWLAPLSQMRDLIVRGARSLSPSRVSVSAVDPTDDPFGPDPGELTGTGSGEGSPAGASQRSASPDMDSFGTRRTAESDRTRNQEAPGKQPGFVMTAEAPGRQSDLDQAETYQQEPQQEEEDEDIWAIEAQRPTPYGSRNVAMREPSPEPSRRAKIPSPWRQNSRRPIYSDELEQYSDRNAIPVGRNAPANEEEEPSMVARTREKQVPVRFVRNAHTNEEEDLSMLSQTRQRKAPAPSKLPATKKSDLFAFFSSPALVPDMEQAPSIGLSKALGSRRLEQANQALPKPRTMPAQKPPQSSGNGLFAQYLEQQTQTQLPSVPQKQLEIGNRQRSVDLFSPVRKSIEPSRTAGPVLRSSSPQSPEETRPTHISQKMDFIPRPRQSGSTGRATAPIPRAVTPESPAEETTLGHISQKMNFTPRQRQSDNTLFQPKPVAPARSLFGNNQVSDFFSQSRQQSQRPRTRPREQEYAEAEALSFAPPARQAVADRAVSPGKSCIRSPLKAKTPGRVVEFASSTLSPLAQAQARAERRASMSPEKEEQGNNNNNHNTRGAQPRRGNAVAVAAAIEAAKENHVSSPPSSPLSLSPSPSPSPSREQQQQQQQQPPPPRREQAIIITTQPKLQPPQQPLSPTRWTRTHWLRLDELLQARKRGTLQLQLERSRRRRRPISMTTTTTTTDCRHLLGKLVTAQGETLALEGWHLDVVEAFGEEISGSGGDRGWDGVQIAKRVFALLVGEERRRLGLVPFRRGGGVSSFFSEGGFD